ncbi:MAG: DUF928 domain-containing protein [Prochloraceae cyanobacterium]
MQKITLTYIVAFSLFLIGYSKSLKAQTDVWLASEQNNQTSFQQPDYEGDAPSGRDRGTGSRTNCPLATSGTAGDISLTPLIPADSRGLTVQESPTIWVRVNYKPDKIEQQLVGEFSLEEIQTNLKLSPKQISVTLPQTSDVFSIPIPHSLEENKWYRWYLVLDCNSQDSDSVWSIDGAIRRVELSDIENQLDTLSPQERIAIYSNQGIWYDALNETAILFCRNQQNPALKQPWSNLLEDVGLENLAQYTPKCLK